MKVDHAIYSLEVCMTFRCWNKIRMLKYMYIIIGLIWDEKLIIKTTLLFLSYEIKKKIYNNIFMFYDYMKIIYFRRNVWKKKKKKKKKRFFIKMIFPGYFETKRGRNWRNWWISRLREKVFCAINDSRSRENEERSKSVSVSNWSMIKQNSIFSGREKLGDR